MHDAPVTKSIESKYRRALVNGGFIASASYGKGFPLVRSWGLRVLGRLVDLFVEKVAQPEALDTTNPPPLCAAEAYESEVTDFGGFEDVYRLRLFDRNMVLRPDAAVFNIRHLMNCREAGGPTQTIAWFQGFRSVHGATPSFFRDRFINPFVQYNRLVPNDQANAASQDTTSRLVAFFDSLCIPVRIVDLGPWKRYARKLYIAVVHLPDGRPTVAAMFYVVGDNYRRQGNVPESITVFDIGITEKVFALVALRHADSIGIRLPSALAPVQVVMTEAAVAALESSFVQHCRIETVSMLDNRSICGWTRRGTPLLVDVGKRGLRVYSRSCGWRDVKAEYLEAVLIEEDEYLWSDCLAADLAGAIPGFAPTSDARGEGYPVVAASQRLTTMLGLPISQMFPNQERAFY